VPPLLCVLPPARPFPTFHCAQLGVENRESHQALETIGHPMSQRRLPHNQDLLVGSLLVVFFVVFGMILCFVVIQPVLIDERVFTLAGGIFLGFAMTVGAVRIALFQGRSDDDRVEALD
jgi:hypothetical protein